MRSSIRRARRYESRPLRVWPRNERRKATWPRATDLNSVSISPSAPRTSCRRRSLGWAWQLPAAALSGSGGHLAPRHIVDSQSMGKIRQRRRAPLSDRKKTSGLFSRRPPPCSLHCHHRTTRARCGTTQGSYFRPTRPPILPRLCWGTGPRMSPTDLSHQSYTPTTGRQVRLLASDL